ncbi:nitronate monooxygenase [Corynebacterium uropygiale]|uniref:Propionate 3-nitronate monooxygenase n=1 Tax=Corynebacterium uropygiale TaxID=1775911 RepID=A0A9X1QPK8_9CORY|nr:nitronate monooxygenase [Corynebacterium uropygiale]MCF4006806.1 nitronate monooxygenase [Corynebacterium uropygiale]
MSVLKTCHYPLVAAPMAGGPSTPELARAVSQAGGLGFLALGTMSPEAARESLAQMTEGEQLPYGVNLFAPQETAPDPAAMEAVREELRPGFEEYGLPLPPLPEPDLSNGWEEKFRAILEAKHPPAIASSTFGCFREEEIRTLHARGIEAWCTVTCEAEAAEAVRRGVDGLIVQGPDAGGHRGVWQVEDTPDARPLPQLTAVIADAHPGVPLIVAGGLGTPERIAEALSWPGVLAVAAGSAFLLSEEAGTSAANRRLLAAAAAEHTAAGQDPVEPTLSTRAFSGRWARGLCTDYCRTHPDPAIPPIYPALNALLGSLRASAAERGDDRWAYCLAGRFCTLAEEKPAGEIVRALMSPPNGG